MTSAPGWISAALMLAMFAPILGAVAAMLTGRRARGALVAGAALAIAAIAAAALVVATLAGGRLEGAFGGALANGPALGGGWRYTLDAFGACALTLTLALGAVVSTTGAARPVGAAAPHKHGADGGAIEPAAVALAAGLGGAAVLSSDLVTAAAAVWAAGVATVAAAAVAGIEGPGARGDRRVIAAAFEALVAISLAGALAVIGAALVASATGGAFWMVSEAADIRSPRAIAFGLGLTLAGLGALAALAPLHGWMAPLFGRSATFAPAVGALAAIAVALRFVGAAVQTGDAAIPWMACVVLATLGAASVSIGALQALAAREAGRFVAYLVTAQIGLTALGVGFGTAEGATAAFLHMALTTLALGVLAAAWPAIGVSGFDGLGARAPGLGAAVTAALLSLLGAPLTAGFAGKWLLAAAALERGWYWGAWLVAGAALAGVVATARVLERVWLRPSVHAAPRFAPSAALAWAGGFACLAFGFDARGAEAIAHTAAQALLGAIR